EPAPGPAAGDRPPPRRRRNRWLPAVVAAVAAGAVAALLVVFLGKGSNDGNAGGPSGSPSGGGSSPTASIRQFPAGTVVYRDGFDDNSGKWDITTEGRFRDGVRNGKYFEEVRQSPSSGVQVFAAAFPHTPDV